MLYNPNLNRQDEKKIHVVDVASTISSYFKDTDIHVDSVGVSHTYFGNSLKDKKYYSNVLKRNIAQLASTCSRRGLIHVDQNRVKNLLNWEITNENVDEMNKQMIEFAKEMKEEIMGFSVDLVKPIVWASIYAGESLFIFLLILFLFTRHIFNFILKCKLYSILTTFLIFIPLYFTSIVNSQFMIDTFGGIWNKGGPILITQFLIVSLTLFLASKTLISIENSSKYSNCLNSLYWSAFIDTILYFLYFTLNRETKAFFERKSLINTFLQYILFFYLLMSISGITLKSMFQKIFQKITGKESTNENLGDFKGFFISFYLFSIFLFFELTRRVDKMYDFLLQMHIIYILFLLSCLTYIFYLIIFNSKRIDYIIVPFIIFAFGLMSETYYRRWLLIIFNFQFNNLLIPACNQLWKICYEKSKIVKEKATLLYEDQYFSLLQQALVLLLISQPSFQFIFGQEDKFSIDAHPTAGGTGMKSHQTHPGFNAFQMAFEKWYLVFGFGFYLWKAVFNPNSKSSSSQSSQQLQKKDLESNMIYVPPPFDYSNIDYVTDIIVLVMAFVLTNSKIWIEMVLVYITFDHAFQESVIVTIVQGVLATVFVAAYVISRFDLFKILKWFLSFCLNNQQQQSMKLKE